jgi:hypothetical protein
MQDCGMGASGLRTASLDPPLTVLAHLDLVFFSRSTVRPTSLLFALLLLELQYSGSGVVVFGTVPKSNTTFKPPTAAYTIDAAMAFVISKSNANINMPDQILFKSPQLSSDQHVLNITVQTAGSPFILQYFFVFPPFNDTQPPTSASPPLPTATQHTTAVITEELSDANVTIRMVAVALGSILALAVVISALFVLGRCRRRRTQALSAVSETYSGSPSSSSRRLRGISYKLLPISLS